MDSLEISHRILSQGFEMHFEEIRRYVASLLSRVAGPNVVDDAQLAIVADTAEKLLAPDKAWLERFDIDREPLPWILTHARYQYLDWLTMNRKHDKALDDVDLNGLVDDSKLPDEGFDGGNDMVELLEAALSQISESEADLIKQVYAQKLTHREIAELEKVSEGTISSRVSRLRNKLRSMVDDLRREDEMPAFSRAIMREEMHPLHPVSASMEFALRDSIPEPPDISHRVRAKVLEIIARTGQALRSRP